MNLNLLKEKKKEKGLTFETLSHLSNVPIQTLHNIFRGHTTNPRIDTLQAIERALGINDGITPEERAAGLGEHPTTLSDREWEWMELGSELLRVQGEERYEAIKALLKTFTIEK